MLISTAKHKRIVAEKDAEIAGLMKRLENADYQADQLQNMNAGNAIALYHALGENADLRTRLAPFTKIRNRDSRGRFIKDTVA